MISSEDQDPQPPDDPDGHPPTRHSRGLLDTDVFLLLPLIADPRMLPEVAEISAMTLGELSAGTHTTSNVTERGRRQMQVQTAEALFDPLPFDAAAARAFGRVVGDLHAAGRKAAVRTKDAVIAATALANNLPLYTVNVRDYRGIEDLIVVGVPHPCIEEGRHAVGR